MSKEIQNELKLVYIVTCFGKVVACHAVAENAFREQMTLVNKGRVAELVPIPVTYDLNLKN